MKTHLVFNGSQWVKASEPVFELKNLKDVEQRQLERESSTSDFKPSETPKEKLRDLLDLGIGHPAFANPVGVTIFYGATAAVDIGNLVNPNEFLENTVDDIEEHCKALIDRMAALYKTPSFPVSSRQSLTNLSVEALRLASETKSLVKKLLPDEKEPNKVPLSKVWNGSYIKPGRPGYEAFKTLSELDMAIESLDNALHVLEGDSQLKTEKVESADGDEIIVEGAKNVELVDNSVTIEPIKVKTVSVDVEEFMDKFIPELLDRVLNLQTLNPQLDPADGKKIQDASRELGECFALVRQEYASLTKEEEQGLMQDIAKSFSKLRNLTVELEAKYNGAQPLAGISEAYLDIISPKKDPQSEHTWASFDTETPVQEKSINDFMEAYTKFFLDHSRISNHPNFDTERDGEDFATAGSKFVNLFNEVQGVVASICNSENAFFTPLSEYVPQEGAVIADGSAESIEPLLNDLQQSYLDAVQALEKYKKKYDL